MQGVFIFGATVALSLVIRIRPKKEPISGICILPIVDVGEVAVSLVTRSCIEVEPISGVDILPTLDVGQISKSNMAAISSQQYWLKYFANNNVVIAAKTNAKLCVSPVAYVKQLNKVEKQKMMPRGPIVVSVSEQEWTLVTH